MVLGRDMCPSLGLKMFFSIFNQFKSKMDKIKKYISIVLSIILVFYSPLLSVVSADEIAPSNETTINNTTTTENTSTTESDTGNNTIAPPTPSPTPPEESYQETAPEELISEDTLTPTPTPDGEVDIENSADLINDVASDALTGENTVESSGSAQTQSDNLYSENTNHESGANPNSIETGDAAAVTDIENIINTSVINSKFIKKTVNLFINTDGDINLSDPMTIASNAIADNTEDEVINVSVTSINNYAYLKNDVVNFANTGNNTIEGKNSEAMINTGNAYSIVSLINEVNFVIVNSEVYIITVNIFGNLNGNIILPKISNSSVNCDLCGVSMINNKATVHNNVDSNAITGQNSIYAHSGTIETGEAESNVNLLNVINTNFIGTNTQSLLINVIGSWDGNFLGWSDFDQVEGGGSLSFSQIDSGSSSAECDCITDTNITSEAEVYNNINSTASTGGNKIKGRSGKITTGNAWSVVSLINLVNSNFINSFGFFGFINVFGNWTGSIGDEDAFAAEPIPEATQATNSDSDSQKEEGGLLNVVQTNNVGDHVLPGDTVTFFVKIKNVGKGRVYGTKLHLFLLRDGVNVGGTTFDIGDIDVSKNSKLNTGFVLSKKMPSGNYTARAYAEGNVGNNNAKVFHFADSEFKVNGAFNSFVEASGGDNSSVKASVLGTNSIEYAKDRAADIFYIYALITVIFSYILIKLIREKEKVMIILSNKISLKEKLRTVKLILL